MLPLSCTITTPRVATTSMAPSLARRSRTSSCRASASCAHRRQPDGTCRACTASNCTEVRRCASQRRARSGPSGRRTSPPQTGTREAANDVIDTHHMLTRRRIRRSSNPHSDTTPRALRCWRPRQIAPSGHPASPLTGREHISLNCESLERVHIACSPAAAPGRPGRGAAPPTTPRAHVAAECLRSPRQDRPSDGITSEPLGTIY